MFQFLNYDFFSGPNALNHNPTNIEDIVSTQISNAVFDHINISKDIEIPVSTTEPTSWDYDTILDSDFNNTINGGNIDMLIQGFSAIKIKRRVRGSFTWVTLTTIPISNAEDLVFTFNDLLNAYDVNYDYALVPIVGDIEGNYIINSVYSKFNGVFIGDYTTIYKFLFNVQYGTEARNQQIGTFQPLGRQYPIIIANGLTSYDSGSVSASILNDDFEKTGEIDPPQIVQKKNAIKTFLTNKQAKILKDWNGNIWLCMIVDSPQITYVEGSGMRIPQVQFNWVEIGNANDQQDLYNNGILPH